MNTGSYGNNDHPMGGVEGFALAWSEQWNAGSRTKGGRASLNRRLAMVRLVEVCQPVERDLSLVSDEDLKREMDRLMDERIRHHFGPPT